MLCFWPHCHHTDSYTHIKIHYICDHLFIWRRMYDTPCWLVNADCSLHGFHHVTYDIISRCYFVPADIQPFLSANWNKNPRAPWNSSHWFLSNGSAVHLITCSPVDPTAGSPGGWGWHRSTDGARINSEEKWAKHPVPRNCSLLFSYTYVVVMYVQPYVTL